MESSAAVVERGGRASPGADEGCAMLERSVASAQLLVRAHSGILSGTIAAAQAEEERRRRRSPHRELGIGAHADADEEDVILYNSRSGTDDFSPIISRPGAPHPCSPGHGEAASSVVGAPPSIILEAIAGFSSTDSGGDQTVTGGLSPEREPLDARADLASHYEAMARCIADYTSVLEHYAGRVKTNIEMSVRRADGELGAGFGAPLVRRRGAGLPAPPAARDGPFLPTPKRETAARGGRAGAPASPRRRKRAKSSIGDSGDVMEQHRQGMLCGASAFAERAHSPAFVLSQMQMHPERPAECLEFHSSNLYGALAGGPTAEGGDSLLPILPGGEPPPPPPPLLVDSHSSGGGDYHLPHLIPDSEGAHGVLGRADAPLSAVVAYAAILGGGDDEGDQMGIHVGPADAAGAPKDADDAADGGHGRMDRQMAKCDALFLHGPSIVRSCSPRCLYNRDHAAMEKEHHPPPFGGRAHSELADVSAVAPIF